MSTDDLELDIAGLDSEHFGDDLESRGVFLECLSPWCDSDTQLLESWRV